MGKRVSPCFEAALRASPRLDGADGAASVAGRALP